MLNPAIAVLLATQRPDSRTWTELVGLLNDQTTATEIAAIKRSLAAWPKELPRRSVIELSYISAHFAQRPMTLFPE